MKNKKIGLLLKNVFPAIVSQVCFFLFTIIDGIFVGKGVGQDALGAINIAFPFVMIINALFMLITVGGVAVMAVRAGRGDNDGANEAFMHAVVCMSVLSVVVSAVGVIFTEQIGRFLGADDVYIGYVYDYLFWYSVFIVPMAFSTLFQFFCRNDGAQILVMSGIICASLLNIALDYVYVFPLGRGIAGAAIATGISQTVGLFIVCMHFVFKKGNLRFVKFRFKRKILKKIIVRGFPESVAQFATPVATMFTNIVLLDKIGRVAVNSYSIINYVASFAVAVFAGVSTGVQPLFGRCYGEKNTEELKFFFKASVIIDLVGSMLVYVVILFVGGAVCSVFSADQVTTEYTIKVLPKFGWGFIIMSLSTIISTYLYSTKRSKEAIILNILRSFVFNIMTIILLPTLFGGEIIWYTFGIYEILSVVAAFILMKYSERNGIIYK